MIAECRAYLADKIRGVMGQETKVFYTLKEVKACAENHMAAVLFASDNNVRNGSKINIMTNGSVGRATKLFDREVKFNVVMSEYRLEALEPLYESFLRELDSGFTLTDGYHVAIDIGEADWISKDDSILKAEVSVEFLIIFRGGVYKKRELRGVSNIITNIEEVPPGGR